MIMISRMTTLESAPTSAAHGCDANTVDNARKRIMPRDDAMVVSIQAPRVCHYAHLNRITNIGKYY
ncbi:hypothetical protein SCLCIDRAFT_1212563 [Scleroderma citrinum Foug A]|uniref:Uncharacterized protein n=1 Tax=Scleroderma citrinum Foug A TaxID=1036808 RepID=A0A0C2ZUA6_9AGAM|nr:hypothetical protein SCLCIDRAFT_1212563 [Scleroderma citrinum Foug A]